MKRLVTIIFLFLLSLSLFAQKAWVVTEDGIVPPSDIFADSPFEWGFTAGVGVSSISFSKAAFRGRPHIDYLGGFSFQYNMVKFLSVRGDAIYERSLSRYPDVSDIFSSGFIYRQSSVTIPVNLLFSTSSDEAVSSFCGFGGYYERMLTSRMETDDIFGDVNHNQWGLSICIGLSFERFSLMYLQRFQMGKIFVCDDYPSASMRAGTFVLAYRFK